MEYSLVACMWQSSRCCRSEIGLLAAQFLPPNHHRDALLLGFRRSVERRNN